MRFGQWYPIEDAEAAAPAMAGVLQARADGPLDYPHGQSAMVLYAHSLPEETLHDMVAARGRDDVARAIAAGARSIRFAESSEPDADFEQLMAGFVERFGAPPRGNG